MISIGCKNHGWDTREKVSHANSTGVRQVGVDPASTQVRTIKAGQPRGVAPTNNPPAGPRGSRCWLRPKPASGETVDFLVLSLKPSAAPTGLGETKGFFTRRLRVGLPFVAPGGLKESRALRSGKEDTDPLSGPE